MSASPQRKTSLSFTDIPIEDWEKVQLKTFVKWANSQIEACCPERCIAHPASDLQDGIVLINLLQSLTGQSLGKFHSNPKMDLHKAENINKALSVVNAFCEEKGLRLQYTAEDFLSGNVKMIMGLLWVLISKFAIDVINEGSLNAREGLLLWCQRKLVSYESIKVENFSRSFSDGLAFCALIHKHQPHLIDFDSLDPTKSECNLRLAFTTAEKEMGIPMLLDPDDFLRTSHSPDEKSVMTYLSFFWRQFANSKSSHVASKRIKKLLVTERENRELALSYELAATDLAKRMDTQTREFLGRNFGRTEEDLLSTRKRLKYYQMHTKYSQLAMRDDIESSLIYLQTKLKQQKRAPYTPPDHCGPERLQSYWADLCAAEIAYEQAIGEAEARVQKVRHLMKAALSQAQAIDEWREDAQNESHLLNGENSITEASTRDAEIALNKHRVLSASASSQNNRLCSLERQLKDLRSRAEIEPSCSTEILQSMKSIVTKFGQFQTLLDTRENSLNARILDLKAKEMKSLEIAQRADDLGLWSLEMKAKLEVPVYCLDINDLADKRERLEMDRESIRLKMEDVVELENLIAAPAGDNGSNYSRLSIRQLRENLEALQGLALRQQSDLDAEEQRHQAQHGLVEQYYCALRKYSDLSTNLHTRWHEGEIQDECTSNDQQRVKFAEGLLHVLREEREKREADVTQAFAQLNTNNIILSLASHDGFIKDSKLPQLSTIRMDLQRLENVILSGFESANEDFEENPALPSAQVEELREMFTEFDPENKGAISKASLQRVLQINDLDISSEDLKPYLEHNDSQGSAGLKSPDRMVQISWDNFLSLMERKLNDSDTYEKILEAFQQVSGSRDRRSVTPLQLRGAIEDAKDVEFLLAEMDLNSSPGQKATYDFVSFVDICYGRKTRREIEEERARALAEEESRQQARREAERQAQEEAERRACEYREAQRIRREQEIQERREREEQARQQAREAEVTALAAAKAAEEAKRKAEDERERRLQEAAQRAREEQKEKMRAEEERKKKERDAAFELEAKQREKEEREEKKRAGKAAYFWKKGGSKSSSKSLTQRRNWNQRYFKVGADGILRYYVDKSDVNRLQPKGEIDIKTVRSIRVTRYRERPYCIAFDIDGSQGRESFLMDAATKEEAEAWVKQLTIYNSLSP